MKNLILCVVTFMSFCVSSTYGASSTFFDYQNYNHGYCPECNCYPCRCEVPPMDPPPAAAPVPPSPCCGNVPSPQPSPCDPCAPVCGAECGISKCTIAIAAAATIGAILIIVASGNGN